MTYISPMAPLVLILAGLACCCFLRFLPAIRKAQLKAKQISECGYLCDPPTDKAHKRLVGFASFCQRRFVGKLELVGQDKLDATQGPFLLVANHGGLFDVAILPLLLKDRLARYPAAQGVMKAFGGWLGYLLAQWGVFAVDLSNGKNAYKTAVKILSSGANANIIGIFPEAQTNMDGVVGPFKTGTVRMAAEASRILGRPVPIVPVYIRYGRYPGHWITKYSFANQWLIALFGSCYWGRGAKVVIGDPITSAELPADPRIATEVLRQRILALDPGSV